MEYEITNTYRNWINKLFYFFFIITLLFPVIVINKLVFLSIIALMAFNYKLYNFKTTAPFVLFIIFLFGYIHSFFYYSDRAVSLQLFLSTLVLFLVFPLNKYKVDLDKIIRKCGIIMVIYTWLSYFIVAGGFPISDVYYDFFFYYSTGSFSMRDFVEEGVITFQMGTLPFLYLPLVLCYISFLDKKKKYGNLLLVILFFMTLWLGGSRSSIMTTIFTLILISFIKFSFKNKIRFLMITIPLVMIVVIYLIENTTVFSAGEESNSVKIGHVNSFIKQLNIFNFLLGEGLASYYYSEGSGKLKAYTEISPLDMLRYLGFVLTPIVYMLLFFPLKRLKAYTGENFLFFVIFLMYVINSTTNPTFFNSYGFLVVLWYWSKIMNYKEEENVGINRVNPIKV
ncbi:MAG: hypothetical protein DI539_12685 [Flavobacterium psychrophilum]|nr:MAG: hypothetical protein DI539_12685 [Flavobacterium psychrophilum]